MTTQDERQNKLIRPSHYITMDDIIREGNPTLRGVAERVALPLSNVDILLGEKMIQFLRNSQDPVMAEKLELRAGVGLAAPQLDISKRIIALLVPSEPKFDEEGNEIPSKEDYALNTVMYNARIISHSVEEAAIATGEGCLSVDREVPGYVVRHARVTIEYYDKNSEKKKIRLKGFHSMVPQHEIDHTDGIMFYDHIDPENPWKMREGMQIID
ncbi:peptide deformylase [Lactovum miscens]|uniref:Peptide deformylase n=1 Tax=Lactovum miscens TaxID=190387 RepID=A0A841C698_9LACT|nr:peptide deformylase [Lactovum miscens]MBB5887864.1 peptide deformylase [Lactovum miscens]